MIDPSVITLSKPNIQSEIPAEKKKPKPGPTRGCGCGNLNAAMRPDCKPSPEEGSQQGFDVTFHRQRLRATALENASKTSPTEEHTPEGVQQFIRHVSSVIERKNPFKDKVLFSSAGQGKADSDTLESIQFHRSSKPSLDIPKAKPLSLERLSDVTIPDKRTGIRQKVTELLSLHHVRKASEVESRSSAGSRLGRKTEYCRRGQRDTLADSKVILELEGLKRQNYLSSYDTDTASVISLPRTPESDAGSEAGTENSLRAKRPSEIPLRKNRTVRATRQYYEAFAKSKPLSPLEKFCPELKLALSYTSEKQNFNDLRNAFLPREQTSENRVRKIKKLLPHYKGSKMTSNYSNDYLEESTEETTQFKIIDLNKMKTTSFTILKNDSVLNKLESLHKRNILEKKKSGSERCTTVGTKTRAALKSLKGKVSKKNLFRTNSKGNKQLLKAKSRSKKEIALFKKESPLNNEKNMRPPFGAGKGRRERRKCANYGKTEPKKDIGVTHTPVKLVRTKAKSFLRGLGSQKDREGSRKSSDTSKAVKEPQKGEAKKTQSTESSAKAPTTIEDRFNRLQNDMSPDNEIVDEKQLSSPPPTPEEILPQVISEATEDEIDQTSTTVLCQKLTTYDSSWNTLEPEIQNELTPEETTATKTHEQDSGVSLEGSDVKPSDSVKGTFGTDEPPEGEELPRVKKRIRIDLKPTENILKCKTIDNNTENAEPCDWLFLNEKNYDDEPPCDVVQTSNPESEKTDENAKSIRNKVDEPFSSELPEESSPMNVSIQKPQRSCSSLKRKHEEERRLYKFSEGATKTSRKKKMRTDSGCRRLPSPSGFFNSDITLLNKAVPDVRPRSGFTKSYVRDEKKDIFEDLALLKLKRRNSEPHSLSGYVWKCSDPAVPRGHKPSVSSLASSLRHLNTDDIDDFTFWEAIPQRKTPWETSLYHFKRPWSVLSCSIFKDNRRSSTPGLILDNLRNGGGGGGGLRRFSATENERLKSHKENPFDVEPSIAQKNIDVRNWLAALNFPTIPSTSSDFLGESNYAGQSTSEAQNSSKIQSAPRRRKVVSNLKFSKEAAEKICEETEKLRISPTWSGSDVESLTELTRRISAGLLGNDQYISSEHAIWPNATLTVCVYSKSFEESFLVETSEGNYTAEVKTVEASSQTQLSQSTTTVDERGEQTVDTIEEKQVPPKLERKMTRMFSSLLKGELNPDINIWKYLFLFTIFTIAIHYFFLGG